MKLSDSVTLFRPICSDDFKTVWEAYLLEGVMLERSLSAPGDGSAVIYLIYNRTIVTFGGVPHELPEIMPGYIVAPGDRRGANPSEIDDAMKIISVENFSQGSEPMHHLKLLLK